MGVRIQPETQGGAQTSGGDKSPPRRTAAPLIFSAFYSESQCPRKTVNDSGSGPTAVDTHGCPLAQYVSPMVRDKVRVRVQCLCLVVPSASEGTQYVQLQAAIQLPLIKSNTRGADWFPEKNLAFVAVPERTSTYFPTTVMY